MKRRHFVLGASAAAVIGAPSVSLALSEGQASGLVNSVVNDINKVIASGKSESGMIRDFARIFDRYADNAYIAAYAMGADARRASGAQKKAFSNAFGDYLARKYGKRFREFIGGQIQVQSVRSANKFYEVRTKAILRGQSPFDVTFLVSDRAGRPLFFNMFIEGINMLATERTEIGAMIDRRGGNIDQMIGDLKRAG
ncbi:MAG: ABC transporter substrate-binding protein [Pseudomonadota bacterium]